RSLLHGLSHAPEGEQEIATGLAGDQVADTFIFAINAFKAEDVAGFEHAEYLFALAAVVATGLHRAGKHDIKPRQFLAIGQDRLVTTEVNDSAFANQSQSRFGCERGEELKLINQL